jgi:hypothetical protein
VKGHHQYSGSEITGSYIRSRPRENYETSQREDEHRLYQWVCQLAHPPNMMLIKKTREF